MAEPIDSFPLKGEYPELILSRLQADQNAGIDPADPRYADLTPGSFWDDMSRAETLEWDRFYDRLYTEIPAASHPLLATGRRLDAWAVSFGVSRNDAAKATGIARFTGADGTTIPSETSVSTEQPTAETDPVTFVTTTGGTITGGLPLDLPIAAEEAGTVGNVPAGAIVFLDSVLDDDTVQVTNPTAITGGDDIETDERLQAKLARRMRGARGGGNADYLISIGLDQPGIGYVTVEPNTPSVGMARITATDINNDPLSDVVVAALQQLYDPSDTATQGAGQAPVGMRATVGTPSPLEVDVVATLRLLPGYSLDGAGSTTAVRPAVTAAIRRYIDGLTSGQDPIRNKVIGAIVAITGVDDVVTLTLNGSPADVPTTAAQVPVTDTVVLSVA